MNPPDRDLPSENLPDEGLPPDRPTSAPLAPPRSAFHVYAAVCAFIGLVLVVIFLVVRSDHQAAPANSREPATQQSAKP